MHDGCTKLAVMFLCDTILYDLHLHNTTIITPHLKNLWRIQLSVYIRTKDIDVGVCHD